MTKVLQPSMMHWDMLTEEAQEILVSLTYAWSDPYPGVEQQRLLQSLYDLGLVDKRYMGPTASILHYALTKEGDRVKSERPQWYYALYEILPCLMTPADAVNCTGPFATEHDAWLAYAIEMEERIESLRAECDDLRAVIQPFADAFQKAIVENADFVTSNQYLSGKLDGESASACALYVTAGDWRRAWNKPTYPKNYALPVAGDDE